MSRSIGEPFADNPEQRPIGALYVIDAERYSVVVAEIEFGELSPNFGDGLKDQAAAWA